MLQYFFTDNKSDYRHKSPDSDLFATPSKEFITSSPKPNKAEISAPNFTEFLEYQQIPPTPRTNKT